MTSDQNVKPTQLVLVDVHTQVVVPADQAELALENAAPGEVFGLKGVEFVTVSHSAAFAEITLPEVTHA